jgi:erythromycin esterase-like protein
MSALRSLRAAERNAVRLRLTCCLHRFPRGSSNLARHEDGLWRTEEYRDLLAWMRAWKADPSHAGKVRFHGLDLGAPALTARRLNAYLVRVDPDVAERVAPVVERLGAGSPLDEGDLDGLLASAPLEGPVREWLDEPCPLRFVGGTFDEAWPEQGADVQPSRLAAEFDALFFVASSTPSRLLDPP